ncbi:MAG: L,D-transpeptidase [Spartobacteria bacterium]
MSNTRLIAGFTAFLLGLEGALAATTSPTPSPTPGPSPNEQILQVQLFLDGSPFKPGVVDGKWGEFTRKALACYKQANGGASGSYGDEPPAHFDLPLPNDRPALTTYRLSTDDQRLIGSIPENHAAQAKLDSLPYTDFLELVAEKFHARQEYIRQLNPDFDWNGAKPGDNVKVPNVTAPFDVQEAIGRKKATEEAEKADTLKTEDEKPENEQFAIFIHVSEKMLELKQSGKLVGSYPITPGSDSLPAPIGEWFIKGFAWMPTFRWDEAMLQRGERSGDAYELPPGPNNPVGIIWMELNHKGSGIHGTEVPETIGRATSHGCIRLSNWDALDLGKKVRPGVHVTIR